MQKKILTGESVQDVGAAIAGPVALHCTASNARLQPPKCMGMLFGAEPPPTDARGLCSVLGILQLRRFFKPSGPQPPADLGRASSPDPPVDAELEADIAEAEVEGALQAKSL